MTVVADHPTELPGLTASFRAGDDGRTEQAVAALKRLDIRRLRVPLAAVTDGSTRRREWIDALLPRLAADFALLVCLPSNAPEPLIDAVTRHAGILGEVEITAEPGKTAQALQLASRFKSFGFLTVVAGST